VRSFIRGSYHTSGEQAFERERILDGIRRLVIIEINVNAFELLLPVADGSGPARELRVRVAALVGSFRTVQTHIGEVGGDVTLGRKAGNFENAECGIVPAQNLINGFGVPGRIAEFKRVAMTLRERAQKGLEPFRVDLPKGRQLKDNWAELGAQKIDPLEVAFDGETGVLQLFHVGNKTAAFGGKAESRGRAGAPVLESGFERQTIEGVVQFDGVEVARVELQHLGGGQLFRIERTAPVAVMPA